MSNRADEYVTSSPDDCRRVGGIFVLGSHSVSNNTPRGIVCVGVLQEKLRYPGDGGVTVPAERALNLKIRPTNE